jgi:Fe-S-cluster containining protein
MRILEEKRVKRCLRCGKCCDNYLGIVPKTKTDNLSPQFVESMGGEEAEAYIQNHSELMGHPCKWLRNLENGLTECAVYVNRSPDCRNYPEGEGDCRVGQYCKEHREEKI